MNSKAQTVVRLATEQVVERLERNLESVGLDRSQDVALIVQLEIARQLSLVVEELRRMGRKNDELVNLMKGIALRMEEKGADDEG